MPGLSGQPESECMKRKIVRRSIAAYLFTLAQSSRPAASLVSQPATACAPQPAWACLLRRAWLAAPPRGPAAMRPLTRYLAATCVALAACAALSAHAQYSNPPTWSPMSMLTVSFDTATLKLDVVDQATKEFLKPQSFLLEMNNRLRKKFQLIVALHEGSR